MEQENALAAMGEKIRQRDEDIVSLKTKLQQQDRTYAGEKQRLNYISSSSLTCELQNDIIIRIWKRPRPWKHLLLCLFGLPQ